MPFRYDIEGLDKDMDIDMTEISKLYDEYFIEMKSNIQESIKLYGSEDFARLERVIHNMKGISSSLNINDIYAAANDLDAKLKRGYFDTASADMDNFIKLFIAAEKDIRGFFKQNAVNL